MPDLYTDIENTAASTQERLAELLEKRAANARQQAMLERYLSQVNLPPDASVLEVGCGTGAVSRFVARRPGIRLVTGIDPSDVFIEHANRLAAGLENIRFRRSDGRDLPEADCSYDGVMFHTTLCHLSNPREALSEAYRVLKPAGWLSVFDGDYTSTTVALGDFDPLQSCVDAWRSEWQHDAALMQRLPSLIGQVGFQISHQDEHEYLGTSEPEYMLTIVDRGAATLESRGIISSDTSAALQREARRRVEEGRFRGSIVYHSLIARKSRDA